MTKYYFYNNVLIDFYYNEQFHVQHPLMYLPVTKFI